MCLFQYESILRGMDPLYACISNNLENENNNKIITDYRGEHLPHKTDLDVKYIQLYSTNLVYIPTSLGSLFDLNSLAIAYCKLVEIRVSDFDGMENLEHLFLEYNELTFIPLDTFSRLLNLKTIELMGNQIQELQNGIFINNNQLHIISITNNEIKYLGSKMFHGLKELQTVYAEDNFCVSNNYIGPKEISNLKRHIYYKCKNKNEIPDLVNSNLDLIKSLANMTELYVDAMSLNLHLSGLEEENKRLMIKLAALSELNKFNVTCEFKDMYEEYICKTHDLMIAHEDMDLDRVIGSHLDSRTNQDVKELIFSNSHMAFISNSIFTRFANVETVRIQNMKLQQLKKGVFMAAQNVKLLVLGENNIETLGYHLFHGMKSLTILMMNSNKIKNISFHAFHELPLLEKLSLKDNLISEIEDGTFKRLVNLETLILSSNKIKFLDGKLFEFNKKLNSVSFARNQITEIGDTLLEYAESLKFIDFLKNWCIDGSTDDYELFKLDYIIKECCGNLKDLKYNYNCGHNL
ncbi:unnamed protein product [Diamesa serratosioi]